MIIAFQSEITKTIEFLELGVCRIVKGNISDSSKIPPDFPTPKVSRGDLRLKVAPLS
jgi:hypothetical protein